MPAMDEFVRQLSTEQKWELYESLARELEDSTAFELTPQAEAEISRRAAEIEAGLPVTISYEELKATWRSVR